MAKTLFTRGETWHYSLWHNGVNARGTCGTTDKKIAKKFHDEVKARLWAVPRIPGKSWDEACIKWLKAAPRLQPDKNFIANFGYANRMLAECTLESFEEMFDDADISNSTYNRRMGRVQAIMRLSGEKTFTFERRKEAEGRTRFLDSDEWDRLYAELPAHLKPMALFAIITGLRKHNVTQLMWSEIDMPRRLMWVHPDQAKAGKAFSVSFDDRAAEVIRGQLGVHKTHVFTFREQPIKENKTAWKAACKRANIKDFTWHGLRHTWASWHVMAGTDLPVLQKLGAWASLKLVERYAHLAPSHVAQFAGNAKPWKRTTEESA